MNRPSTTRRGVAALSAILLALGLAVVPGAAAMASGPKSRAVTPVAALDLQRYSGRWLQLASTPAPFTAQCARDTQAEYTPLPDGLVKVVNSCVLADGSTTVIEGRARVTGPDSNAQLEVTFAQVNGEFLFRAAGAYWVIGLDATDYSWAVVGNPDRASGFVLSRTPTLTAKQIAGVVRAVVRNGYDPCTFIITATTGGIETNTPLCGQ